MISQIMLLQPPNQMMFLVADAFTSLRDNVIGGIVDINGALTDLISPLASSVQGGFSGATNNSMMSAASDAMRFGSFDATVVQAIMSSVTAPLGFVLMVVYTVAGILRKVNSGREIGFEDIVAPCLFVILADLALTNSGKIVGALMGISNGAADALLQQLKGEAFEQEIKELTETQMKNSSVVELLALVWASWLSWLVGIVARLVLFVVVLTAKIELLIRLSFSPIGLASLADEGNRSEGFRYLKKLLAASLTCVAVIAAVNIAIYAPAMINNTLGSTVTNESTIGVAFSRMEASFLTCLAPFVAIGSVSAAKSAINEVMGV